MQELIDAMADMQEDQVTNLTKQYLEDGKDALDILKAYQEAMSIVGKRFEEQTYFIPELVLSGVMMKNGAELIKPYMKKDIRNDFKVIIGGAQLDQQVCDSVGADAFVTDVVAGIKTCKEWTGTN